MQKYVPFEKLVEILPKYDNPSKYRTFYNAILIWALDENHPIKCTMREKFPIGSVALIEKAYLGDLGFDTPIGLKTLFDTKVLDSNIFPFKEGALCRLEAGAETEEFLKRFKPASAVTRQTFTGDRSKRDEIVSKFNSEIEDMEGAALHYVCLMEKIPFFQLRGVSNEVGERDRGKWNAPLALDAIKKAMLEFFRFECKG